MVSSRQLELKDALVIICLKVAIQPLGLNFVIDHHANCLMWIGCGSKRIGGNRAWSEYGQTIVIIEVDSRQLQLGLFVL